MRVLVVTHNNNELSGANRSLLGILETWRKECYDLDVSVLVNSSKGNLPQKIDEIGWNCIVEEYDWNCVPKRSSFFRQLAVIIRGCFRYFRGNLRLENIERVIESGIFDVIYTNTSVVDIGARLAIKMQIPHIWHIREFGKEDFGYISLITNKTRQKLLKSSDKIITISNAIKGKYINMGFEDKTVTIYNGFDTEKLSYDVIHACHSPVRILISGQIGEGKSQHYAIEAVVRLHEKYDIELYIAGSGDFKYLKKHLDRFNNPDYIKVLGQVSDMYELRKNVDIELVCSRREGFGRVTIEAMLHSVPVIGADTGGTSELIKDGYNGLLYEYGNISDLCQRIEELLLDDELRSRIAARGHETAMAYTIESTGSKIYNTLLCSVQ